MDHFEKTAAKQYLRQIAFLIAMGNNVEAVKLIGNNAYHDSDISEDMYDVLYAIVDGIQDYVECRLNIVGGIV